MDPNSLNSYPATAAQAKAFTASTSLSLPGGVANGNMTPPSENDGSSSVGGTQSSGYQAAQSQANGAGVTPTTPAATPAAGQPNGPIQSGIVPTLQ